MPTERWRSHQGGVGSKAKGSRRPRHGMSYSNLYRIWNDMRRKDELRRKRIVMWPAWKEDFRVFEEWARNTGYTESANPTLVRRDPDRGHNPQNCKWDFEPQGQVIDGIWVDEMIEEPTGEDVLRGLNREGWDL